MTHKVTKTEVEIRCMRLSLRKLTRTDAASLLCPSAWCGYDVLSQHRCHSITRPSTHPLTFHASAVHADYYRGRSIPQNTGDVQASMKHCVSAVYRYGDEVPVRQPKHVLKYDSRSRRLNFWARCKPTSEMRGRRSPFYKHKSLTNTTHSQLPI